MKIRARVILAAAAVLCTVASYGQKRSGNPIFEGRYADPEGVVFGNTYWIYPTYSAPFDDQLFFDAFSSKDLVKWTKHERIIDSSRIKWLRRALWAPAAIEKDGKYYLFFGANDVHEGEIGGIGVAVADNPAGPFEDYLGKPLIGEIINGAQPIDQFVFKDKDGTLYMYYGGWRHCNVAKLRDDLRGFVPFDDGETFKEVTPEGYVEGPFMFIRDGKYYFMWSEGGWTGPDYRVAYAVSDNPLGPFVRKGVILRTDENVATGAGHHSVLHNPRSGKYYIVYHRHPLGSTDGNDRVTCIDLLEFDENGDILPVKMTFEGVGRDKLNPSTGNKPQSLCSAACFYSFLCFPLTLTLVSILRLGPFTRHPLSSLTRLLLSLLPFARPPRSAPVRRCGCSGRCSSPHPHARGSNAGP